MSIKSNIEEIGARIAAGDTEFGEQVKKKAVRAMKEGENSAAWSAYMELFSRNPAELARLLGTDGTSDDWEREAFRANLVGAGVRLDFSLSGESTKLGDPD